MERRQVSPGDLGKVVRFEIEHEDGTVVRYDGEEAAAHEAALSAACAIASAEPLGWAVCCSDTYISPRGFIEVDIFACEEDARRRADALMDARRGPSQDTGIAPLLPAFDPVTWPTALPFVYKLADGQVDFAQAIVQVGKLAEFIMAEVGGEPGQDEGAVETAIRLLRAAYVGHVVRVRLDLTEPPFLPERVVPRLVADLRRFIEWYGPFGVLEGLQAAFNSAPAPHVVDRMIGEHLAVRELLKQLAGLWEGSRKNGEG